MARMENNTLHKSNDNVPLNIIIESNNVNVYGAYIITQITLTVRIRLSKTRTVLDCGSQPRQQSVINHSSTLRRHDGFQLLGAGFENNQSKQSLILPC